MELNRIREENREEKPHSKYWGGCEVLSVRGKDQRAAQKMLVMLLQRTNPWTTSTAHLRVYVSLPVLLLVGNSPVRGFQ